MEKEEPLSERSEFRIFPFFVLHKREPRRGGDAWVAFFCFLFLANARKGSSCRATPGLQSKNTCASVQLNRRIKHNESEINDTLVCHERS